MLQVLYTLNGSWIIESNLRKQTKRFYYFPSWRALKFLCVEEKAMRKEVRGRGKKEDEGSDGLHLSCLKCQHEEVQHQMLLLAQLPW